MIREIFNRCPAERIVNFDELSKRNELLAGLPYSTGVIRLRGQFIWGTRISFFWGMDCNYREIVPGAVKEDGGTLTIAAEKENPNYFFQGYQRKGDRYNIPNPNREIHLESWRVVGAEIDRTNASVLNANPQSRVDAFDFCVWDDVLKAKSNDDIPVISGPCLRPEESGKNIVGVGSFGRDAQIRICEVEVVRQGRRKSLRWE